LREARWLEQSITYREDALFGPYVAMGRAQILAQVGEADAAIDELARLLATPSDAHVTTLRLDPLWDPIREHPRFKALLAKHSS
jgi:serine/threonine-protein kinase